MSSPLCPFCNLYDETPLPIFYECDRIKCLWSDLVQYFHNSLVLPASALQSVVFVFLGSTSSDSKLKKKTLNQLYSTNI